MLLGKVTLNNGVKILYMFVQLHMQFGILILDNPLLKHLHVEVRLVRLIFQLLGFINGGIQLAYAVTKIYTMDQFF